MKLKNPKYIKILKGVKDFQMNVLLYHIHINLIKRSVYMTNSNVDVLGKFIDATEIAHVFGLSRPGIFNLIKAGKFPPGIKIGRSRRWNLNDVQAWIENQKGDLVHGQ